MTEALQAYAAFGLNPTDFNRDMQNYTAHGYVLLRGDFLAMGKPVDLSSARAPRDQWHVADPDAWYIHFFIGKERLSNALSLLPFYLPSICFERFTRGGRLRIYKLKELAKKLGL